MCSLALIKIKQSYSVSLRSPRTASLEQDLKNDLKTGASPYWICAFFCSCEKPHTFGYVISLWKKFLFAHVLRRAAKSSRDCFSWMLSTREVRIDAGPPPACVPALGPALNTELLPSSAQNDPTWAQQQHRKRSKQLGMECQMGNGAWDC